MMSMASLLRNHRSRLAFRLGWPVVVAVTLLLAAFAYSLTSTWQKADQIVLGQQKAVVQQWIEDRSRALSRKLEQDAPGDGQSSQNDNHVFVIRFENGVFYPVSNIAQTDLDVFQKIAESMRAQFRDEDHLSDPLITIGNNVYIVGLAKVKGLKASLIAFEPFQTAIKQSGRVGLPPDLRIEGREPDAGLGTIAVRDASHQIRSHIVWTASGLGAAVQESQMPLIWGGGLTGAVAFLLLILYVRSIASELSSAQEQAQMMAGRDPLSGLPNRFLFTEKLEAELKRTERMGLGLAILYLDLDRFKEVNDTFGHPAGDELIEVVASRLLDLLRGADTLARFGGDEFAIIQTDVRSVLDVEALARRVLEALRHPFILKDAEVSIGVSIGIAMSPENGTDREKLMRLADAALYRSKNEGRNRFTFFERQMDETIRMKKIVEDDLRRAIQESQLELHYQPIYSADGLSMIGVEALVRWPHPKHGLISPGQFIAMAEERGLIVPLGEWVLRRACLDGRNWPDLKISVNVSPIQFRHKKFVETVRHILQETSFDASRLELELTEGVVVDDADGAELAMMQLRALGAHLALDDFGTGYSSLIYLRRFAFDKIKIDRSFLQSIEDTGESAILVHSIVHLGRALGLIVTAEGVETPDQHRFLQALGCHELQGYLFSKPVPASAINQLQQQTVEIVKYKRMSL